MQSHFTYDELTPLEQCIAEFMARQHGERKPDTKKKKSSKRARLDA